LAHNSNWWMILYACMKRVLKKQGKYVSPLIHQKLSRKKLSYRTSLVLCVSTKAKQLAQFEELVMLMFYNLVESKLPEIPQEFSDEEISDVKNTFTELGFSTPEFLDMAAKHILEHSSNKKANEMYAWGAEMRRQDERLHKRTVAAIVGLSVLGGALFLSAVPMIVVTPPLAIAPITLGFGVGVLAATKATPGGLVSIVVGCLQQRLALAVHGKRIEDYYV
jgi:hypothetical protein